VSSAEARWSSREGILRGWKSSWNPVPPESAEELTVALDTASSPITLLRQRIQERGSL